MDDPNMHAYGGEGPDDAEIGRRWRENSSLEKWFPLTAERLVELEAENAALKREAHAWWTAARDAEKRAQRVPLDTLDIEEMWDEVTGMDIDDWHQEFARRIERRHGIGA